MKLSRFLAFGAVALVLAGCAAPLTPEQEREQVARKTPLAKAAVPACVAAAQGRAPDYAPIRALGFKKVKRIMQFSGDHFDGPDVNWLNGGGTRLDFDKGQGCTVSYSHDLDDMLSVWKAWVLALQAAGYNDTGSSITEYTFVADGVKMEMHVGSRAATTSTASANFIHIWPSTR